MDLFTSPNDPVPVLQDRALESIASTHKDLGGRATPQNVAKYERTLAEDLDKIRKAGDDRPFFRSLICRAEPFQTISSRQWNEAQKRLRVDLLTLFQSLEQSSGDDVYAGELSRERFLQTKAGILKVINEIKLYQFLKANPDYQDAKFIDFHASLNETTKAPAAVVDPEVRLLELAPRGKDRVSQVKFDLRETSVSIEVLGASGSEANVEFAPSRMLDSNPESFWADVAMTDSPVSQTYKPSGDGGLGTSITADGVVVHVTLSMSQSALANNLRILPFGEFPVRVIDVAYKESNAQDQWMQIPGFTVEESTLDWVEVNFEPRTISQIRITLLQSNYTVNTYLLPENLVRNAVLWQQISHNKIDNTISQVSLTDAETSELLVSPASLASLHVQDEFSRELEKIDLRNRRETQYDVSSKLVKAAALSLSKINPALAEDVLFQAFGEKGSTPAKTLSIKKYEYVYGIRSVELNRIVYQPVGHYSSQKFSSRATTLEISITTEERHSTTYDGLSEYSRTSTEWEVEISKDRRYAIAPRNWEVDGEIVVPAEQLQFDRISRKAITRLPIADRATILRRNGERIPLTDYAVEVSTVTDPMSGSSLAPADRPRNTQPLNTQIGRGVVTITNPDAFDPGAVYTLQYVADEGSDTLSIDGSLNSTALVEPEVFTETNREQAIVLSRVPYIDYNIVNSDKWIKDSDQESKWRFTPTLPNYKTGTVSVTSGSANVTGLGTLWLSNVDDSLPFAIQVEDDDSIYVGSLVGGNTAITLAETYKGTSDTGLSYSVGECFESDGYVYGLDNIVYEPIKVYVNDVKAHNLTDYEALEHQAFTEKPMAGRQYQYIQVGNVLYFNAPISNARIEVYYSWLTEYIQVNGVLRCNVPVATYFTPQVNSIRAELKTSKL